MAIKVFELELSKSGFALDGIDLTGYSHAQVLVRLHGRPLGYAWVKLEANLSPANRVHMLLEILRQVQWPLLQAALYKSLSELQHGLSRIESIGEAGPSDLPLITVAIVTRNRPESLERTLNSLAQLDYPVEKLEVLVVDNAPVNESTRRIVAKFPEFRYIVEPQIGLSWGRNRAIIEARGEIIAFTDDDVEVDAGWVHALGRQFENSAVMAVTGLVAPACRDTKYQNIFEELGGFGKGFERRYFALPLQKSWPYFPLGAGSFGTGANMAYRKSLFAQIGPFDEALGVGTPASGAEDIDMFYRVVQAGHLLVYEPAALVWHYHRQDYAGLKRQLQGGLFCVFTKVFVHDRPMRWKALAFAMWWFYHDHLLRAFGSRERVRRRLMWARVWNALGSPLKYFLSVRYRDRLIKQTATLN